MVKTLSSVKKISYKRNKPILKLRLQTGSLKNCNWSRAAGFTRDRH